MPPSEKFQLSWNAVALVGILLFLAIMVGTGLYNGVVSEGQLKEHILRNQGTLTEQGKQIERLHLELNQHFEHVEKRDEEVNRLKEQIQKLKTELKEKVP